MEPILEEILKDCSPRMREVMLANSKSKTGDYEDNDPMHTSPIFYKNWQLLQDPAITILKWQELIDRHRIARGLDI